MSVRTHVRRRAAWAVALATLAAGAAVGLRAQAGATGGTKVTSLYDIRTSSLDGKPADLGAYRGKVAVVVNVASKCGFTPQYAGLEKLYAEMKDKDVVVLGFPSNDFGDQEPGTAEEIATFCRLTYGVSFPMLVTVPLRVADPVVTAEASLLTTVAPPGGTSEVASSRMLS